jgi:hypothetical protein
LHPLSYSIPRIQRTAAGVPFSVARYRRHLLADMPMLEEFHEDDLRGFAWFAEAGGKRMGTRAQPAGQRFLAVAPRPVLWRPRTLEVYAARSCSDWQGYALGRARMGQRTLRRSR